MFHSVVAKQIQIDASLMLSHKKYSKHNFNINIVSSKFDVLNYEHHQNGVCESYIKWCSFLNKSVAIIESQIMEKISFVYYFCYFLPFDYMSSQKGDK